MRPQPRRLVVRNRRERQVDARTGPGLWGLLVAALAAGGVALPAAADDVYLKNGEVFENVVAREVDGAVVIRLEIGAMKLPFSQVERVVRQETPLQRFDGRWQALQESVDVDEWLELAGYAKRHGLSEPFRQTTLHLAELAPGRPQVVAWMEELGFVRDGQLGWVTHDDFMRRRGFVQHEGSWVSPDEFERRASVEADLERRRLEARLAEVESALRDSGSSSEVESAHELVAAQIDLLRDVVVPQRSSYPHGTVATFAPTAGGGYVVPPLALSGGAGARAGGAPAVRSTTSADEAWRAVAARQPGSLIPVSAFARRGQGPARRANSRP